jgi:hypothetical protein
MIIPIEPAKDRPASNGAENSEPERGFAIVDAGEPGSPREEFERRAAEIALAAEFHVRRMMEEESRLAPGGGGGPAGWTVEAEHRDTVPFGLKRRVVLRVPVFRREDAAEAPEDEILLPEELGLAGADSRSIRAENELRRIRGLMAQIAVDLIAQVIEINRYFASAGLVRPPELHERPVGAQEREEASPGNTMSGGNAGFSFRRRA